MKEQEANGEARVLCWPGRLLSEDDLRRHLTCQSEILLAPKTVVTPLALDHLRGKGVRIRREDSAGRAGSVGDRSTWGHAQDTNDALAAATLTALRREGIALVALPGKTPREWAKSVADGAVAGAVVFTTNAGLVCCVANKVGGVRGVPLTDPAQAKRARQTLGANLFAIECSGRTFHELRQMVKAAVAPATCPADVARILQELDGHAHR